jgi:hypothetical protein
LSILLSTVISSFALLFSDNYGAYISKYDLFQLHLIMGDHENHLS